MHQGRQVAVNPGAHAIWPIRTTQQLADFVDSRLADGSWTQREHANDGGKDFAENEGFHARSGPRRQAQVALVANIAVQIAEVKTMG